MKQHIFKDNLQNVIIREFSHGNYDNLKEEVRVPIKIEIKNTFDELEVLVLDERTHKQLKVFHCRKTDVMVVTNLLMNCTVKTL